MLGKTAACLRFSSRTETKKRQTRDIKERFSLEDTQAAKQAAAPSTPGSDVMTKWIQKVLAALAVACVLAGCSGLATTYDDQPEGQRQSR